MQPIGGYNGFSGNPFERESKEFLEGVIQAIHAVKAAADTIMKYVSGGDKQKDALLYFLDRYEEYIERSITKKLPKVEKYIIVTGRVIGENLVIPLPREIARKLKEKELPVLIQRYTSGLTKILTINI